MCNCQEMKKIFIWLLCCQPEIGSGSLPTITEKVQTIKFSMMPCTDIEYGLNTMDIHPWLSYLQNSIDKLYTSLVSLFFRRLDD